MNTQHELLLEQASNSHRWYIRLEHSQYTSEGVFIANRAIFLRVYINIRFETLMLRRLVLFCKDNMGTKMANIRWVEIV